MEGKGQDTLIRVFASLLGKMSNIVLIIAGNGHDLIRLKEITLENSVQERVVFLGGL